VVVRGGSCESLDSHKRNSLLREAFSERSDEETKRKERDRFSQLRARAFEVLLSSFLAKDFVADMIRKNRITDYDVSSNIHTVAAFASVLESACEMFVQRGEAATKRGGKERVSSPIFLRMRKFNTS
jgi:uncharacterized membrane protein